ncbi:MAG TPA: hypothetical protein VNA69_10335 [Thermoanaerobaculia bacterium]|nr:hypothetical protein [Thermoanaerobaculia bacterium]
MSCARENELLETVSAGRWPDGCDEELRAHAASCEHCRELAAMAALFHAEMQDAMRDAQLPSSGLVWWRAQRRARAEAARTASRAITLVQAASVAGAIAFALMIIGGVSVMSESWRTWLPRISEAFSTTWSLPLTIALAVFLTLTPVALYFVLAED